MPGALAAICLSLSLNLGQLRFPFSSEDDLAAIQVKLVDLVLISGVSHMEAQ